ncbi:hypothetical protein L1049_025517 [Liquidambar formosana]|uniref:Late embryogenesis abundant protein, LEA-18 n=1 Tax=Liquidambar formosana TaxID=63359 RepID=A0AAP0NF79_LIQFO
MSRSGEQMARKAESEEQEATVEGLPLESSPYVKYTDLEDYKRKAYGTEGHLDPKPGRGAGGTDAPTLSGSGLSDGQVSAIDTANRQGIP